MASEQNSTSLTDDCVNTFTPQPANAVENGTGKASADEYRKILVEHWAAAFVDGPMKTIEQYDRTAKLLVTAVTPLQAALFAAYGLLVPKVLAASPNLEAPPDWFTSLLLILFVASVAGVFICVVYACNERPKLIIENRGLLSGLLEADKAALPSDLPKTVRCWEEETERVLACKHWWLTMGFCCFFAGSVVAVVVLINFALGAIHFVVGPVASGCLVALILRGAWRPLVRSYHARKNALNNQTEAKPCTT